jgi:predicted transcriptional regulator
MQLRDSPAAAILATIQRQTITQTDGLVGYEHIQKGLQQKGVKTNLQSLRVYVQRLKHRQLIKTQYITYTEFKAQTQGNKYAYFNLTKKGKNLLNKWQQLLTTKKTKDEG